MYRISTALQEQKGSGTYRVDAQAADFSKPTMTEILVRNFLHGTFVLPPASFLVLRRI
jgi:hypothetical protein